MLLTPKFDGASLVVNEADSKAWTRGDGEVGQDSTEHLKKINAKLSGKDFYSVGEVIMKREVFEKKYKDEFKNPRNLVSGKMNDKHPSEVLKDLDYVRYGIHGGEYLNMDKEEHLNILNKNNSSKVPYKKVKANEITTEM